MKWFVLYEFICTGIRNRWKVIESQLMTLYRSPFFFVFLYLFLYGFHCLWNWSEFMNINRNLELSAINSGQQVSLWSLYPFQIVSVLLVGVLYFLVSLSINLLFSFGKKAKETFRTNITDFFRSLTRQFFQFVCILFIGNQCLGFFQYRIYYSVLVVMFWTGLFLFFIIQNGELYKRLFVSSDRSVSFLSHSLGYVNPILFMFFVLVLANV
ncbi:hypothetical protein LEP1GSC195_2321 [Leptospira wolbachii serovar Codice str. CDC]|uniref:PF14093 domain protein n=1 Tax=Leptospira wolbachii serovar Codice str. CDC TaxID=1218599 RepID=R8ZZN3_9LEPT|nr:hypothetical protein [Leptospira wolbachii]EOQ95441.1 hypothetical protein LEP1GSC195_2321 [Leptospira wolbachii serovar Codice str. CDC]